MIAKSWEEMTNDEKLDRLTSVLTRAGSDIKFRDRCLVSPESAKKAVSEAGEIDFPPDFEIEFLTPGTAAEEACPGGAGLYSSGKRDGRGS